MPDCKYKEIALIDMPSPFSWADMYRQSNLEKAVFQAKEIAGKLGADFISLKGWYDNAFNSKMLNHVVAYKCINEQ
jgi:hypothetical protein